MRKINLMVSFLCLILCLHLLLSLFFHDYFRLTYSILNPFDILIPLVSSIVCPIFVISSLIIFGKNGRSQTQVIFDVVIVLLLPAMFFGIAIYGLTNYFMI